MKMNKIFKDDPGSWPDEPYRITWGMVWDAILHIIFFAMVSSIVGGIGILIIDKSVNGG